MSDGMPRMMVKWKTAMGDEDFSMKTLFGAGEDIPLEYLTNMTKSRIAAADKARARLTITQPADSSTPTANKRTSNVDANRLVFVLCCILDILVIGVS